MVHHVNPDNPMVRSLDDQWIKIACLILYKGDFTVKVEPDGTKHKTVTINEDDVKAMAEMFSSEAGNTMPTITIHETNKVLHLTLESMESAKKRMIEDQQKRN